MTPGVVANVRENISSSLRSWIIESLEHFGVDSRVFLHVIQSILEQDVRSLRGEDALDDLWRGRLASVGAKRGGGRDPKRQMNEEDLRRCVLLENMRSCFKQDEFDVAEEFVDELLHRWTEETRMNVESNGVVKNSSEVLHEEMDDEENKETKDPVREYNEAFPALGSSPRASPANQTEPPFEPTGRQNGNCAELLKDLFRLSVSSRNPESVCPDDSILSCMERAKCCREFAKSMARDFVNSSVVAANTQQRSDSVHLLSNELLEHCNDVVPDLSPRRFFANELRANVSYRSVGAESALEDSGGRPPVPSLQSEYSVQELNSHLVEMSNDACPALGEGSKFFQPLSPGVLSRTVERILSQSLEDLACCHHVPEGGPHSAGSSLGCMQCSSRRRRKLDFPIYTENEFGMLIRLGEDCNLIRGERTNRNSYGKKGVVDASHFGVGSGEDAPPVSTGNLLMRGGKGRLAMEGDLSVSRRLFGPVLQGQGSGWKGADEVVTSGYDETGQQRDDNIGCCMHNSQSASHSSVATASDSGLFCRFNHDAVSAETRPSLSSCCGLYPTGRAHLGGVLPSPSHSRTVDAVGTASQLEHSEIIDFLCFGIVNENSRDGCHRTDTEVGVDSANALSVDRTRSQPIVTRGNVEGSSSAGPISSLLVNDDDAAAFASRVPRDRQSSCDVVLRLLADVIERDLMNHIASSLIPLFPDLSAPLDLFLPDTEILAHLTARKRPHQLNCADALGQDTFHADECENDYALYLHLAVRQEYLDVDHVLNFRDFCLWRKCLVERVITSGKDITCICELCHRALKRRLVDSRYALIDVVGSEVTGRKPVADSECALECESLLNAKYEQKELQLEKQGPDGRKDSGSFHSSSNPAFVLNACLQNSSAGTGDFTGNLDGILTGKVVPGGKDGSHGCGSVGEGDVLLQRHSPIDRVVGVFGRNSMRAIWPDGDTDHKSDDCSGLKEDFEENNNILQSFGLLPETSASYSWSLSEGVAVGNSVNIWLNSGSSALAGAAPRCKKATSATKSCDNTVLHDIAGKKRFSGASQYNTAGYAFDFGVSAGNVCDKVASVATICNESAATCYKPSIPSGFSDQSALIRSSFDESSLSTASSDCRNWFCSDVVPATVTAAAISSGVSPSESKLVECLSPSMQTLERLLSSDEESSSSVQSFRSALHEDFYSLWLNASPTRDHESGPLCVIEETSSSSDCGSQSLGSDDDDVLRNSDVHYEADISSSDSSFEDGCQHGRASDARKGKDRKVILPSEAELLFGLSFPLPSQPSSFSSDAIDDIVSTRHSNSESSHSSLIDSSQASDASDLSKPYSADCNSSGEHLAEERKGLLSDWNLRRPHPETHEGPTDRCQTDSEDLDDPTPYKNCEECSSENFGRVIPTWDVDLPDSGNLTGLTFDCGQQEVVDLEKFENLKSIWDGAQLNDFKDLTSDCEVQESLSVDFMTGSFPETFNQLNMQDVNRQLPPSDDLECSTTENYGKLAVLWGTDQPKVTAFWENNDLKSWRGLAARWNEQVPEFERGSGVTPDWNMSKLGIDWNEQQTDGAMVDDVLKWNIQHQPIADSGIDLTSCWGQQQSGVEILKGATIGCGTVRSDSENLKELTDKRETVDMTDNFGEMESIWIGKNGLTHLKGGKMQLNPIDLENSAAFALDNNEKDSDPGDMKNLASLKSLWEDEGLCPTSSNGSNVGWDLSHVTADCTVGVASSCCGHQTAELGNYKDLTELRSIWEEKEPCVANSMELEQNWEINQMGGYLRNANELQQTWGNVNQMEAEDLLERASNCHQQLADDSMNVKNLVERSFIWEVEDSGHLKGMSSSSSSSCCNHESTAKVKKSKPSSDNNQLNAEQLMELRSAVGNNVHQAANMEKSKDIRFLWEAESRCNDENANGLTPNWDQQELGPEAIARPETGSLHATSDLDNCFLLTSIWERRDNESGRTSSWEVVGSTLEGNTAVMTVPTCDANHKVVAECARNDVGDCQNPAQSLWKGKQNNQDGLKGTIWDMNPNDSETKGVRLTYICHPQDNETEAFKNLTQLKSLWGESESNLENVSGAKLNWEMDPSGTKNFTKLAPGQDQEDAGPSDSFQNLKSIWDEKLPDSEDVKGLLLDWDIHPTDAMRPASDQEQQEADPGNFQNLAQLKSIWEEKTPDDPDSSKGVNWGDINRMVTLVLPKGPNQKETDPGNFLNLSEVKSIWEGKQCSSENPPKLLSCWENQAPEVETVAWNKNQQTSENLTLLKLGIGQKDNDCRNLESIWKGPQPGVGNLQGPTASCWKQQRVESEVSKGPISDWNVTHLNSESFDNSLFDLNCRNFESENFEDVMLSHGVIKQSNSEIFLDRKTSEPKCFRRPTSNRAIATVPNVDLWQSHSDELKQMISRWDKQQTTESRRIRGLFSSHFDSQQSNLAAEWQLAEAVDRLTASNDASTVGRRQLAGRNNVLPKLVPSENSAFQDEIPHRFVYRYAFFDPRDGVGRQDLETRDARIETIRHIYEPSNLIVRQLEDLFDDGQRLHTEEALLANLPNCLFRPIGQQNSGCDSRQSVAASAGGLAADDPSLQTRAPSVDPSEEVIEPSSPYQLYLGVESQAFVPRFRVHKELEKSAQTGEATPPLQNNECVFGMNVILSTIALLE